MSATLQRATGAVRVIEAHEFRGAVGASRIKATERVCGSVTIWQLEATAAEFDVVAEPTDYDFMTFSFIQRGEVLSKYKNGPWATFGRSLVVTPRGLTRRLRFDAPCRLVTAQVPASALAGFVTDLPSSPQVLSDHRILERALLGFLNAVTHTSDAGSAIDRYAIEHLVLEMCGAILLNRLGTVWSSGSPGAALRDRALAVIAQQCEDTALTPSRVARDVQSSLRQLQSVFADAGTTIAGEIRRHRARLARATLTDSRFDALTVEQVAQRSGFGNTMSLRRALRDVYGLAPKELRRTRAATTD